MKDAALEDTVGEIIHRACKKEQSIPDLSLGNQFANSILSKKNLLLQAYLQPSLPVQDFTNFSP